MITPHATLPDLVVLSLLSESPMHGYQLWKELERREVKDWAAISRAQVYYSLQKLREEGWATPIPSDMPSAGAERTPLAITSAGVETLEAGLNDDRFALQRDRPPFLTWLALCSHSNVAVIQRIINVRRDFLTKELNQERRTLDAIAQDTGEMTTAAQLMVQLVITFHCAELQWLAEVEKTMVKKKPEQRRSKTKGLKS